MQADPRSTTRDALMEVSTSVADITQGYEVLVARAEEDLKPFVERLHVLHRAHHGVLNGYFDEFGIDPGSIGSAMGLVHETVALLRDWVGACDITALPQIIEGEEALVSTYDDAIAATGHSHDLNRALIDQRDALCAQIEALKS